MRELIFELDYRPGWSPVADTLSEHPSATIRSLSCHVTADNLWRVDHVDGPPNSLDAIESAYKTTDYFADCLVTDGCESTSTTRVLDRTDESLIIYCVWERSEICTSVPHLALAHLGEGLLFETRQAGRTYTWRIVIPGDEPIGSFADALKVEIEDVGGMELLRLTEHTPPGAYPDREEPTDLPVEQRRALHAAVANGYYETPRKVELAELAAELDIPQSTLSYRLRRAEAKLAAGFVSADSSLDSVSAN